MYTCCGIRQCLRYPWSAFSCSAKIQNDYKAMIRFPALHTTLNGAFMSCERDMVVIRPERWIECFLNLVFLILRGWSFISNCTPCLCFCLVTGLNIWLVDRFSMLNAPACCIKILNFSSKRRWNLENCTKNTFAKWKAYFQGKAAHFFLFRDFFSLFWLSSSNRACYTRSRWIISFYVTCSEITESAVFAYLYSPREFQHSQFSESYIFRIEYVEEERKLLFGILRNAGKLSGRISNQLDLRSVTSRAVC